MSEGKSFFAKAEGIDEELGVVYGFAIVCKSEGEDYFDLQGDHIPEDAMTEALASFMKYSRVSMDMHDGKPSGNVLFAFPLTTDIAKSMGIETSRTGAIIGMKPDNPETLAKFKNGTYTGFSIGGRRISQHEVD